MHTCLEGVWQYREIDSESTIPSPGPRWFRAEMTRNSNEYSVISQTVTGQLFDARAGNGNVFCKIISCLGGQLGHGSLYTVIE